MGFDLLFSIQYGSKHVFMYEKKKGRLKGIALIASVGIAMVVSTLLGLAAGLYLDSLLGTKPWLTIICLILGIIAGFRNVYITVKKYGF